MSGDSDTDELIEPAHAREFELFLFAVGLIAAVFWVLMEFFPSFCSTQEKSGSGRSGR